MKPRVFVSSVIEDFKEYREAARKGILLAGGEPILIEDYPSLTVSPRDACLDGVVSSDILLSIIGERAGSLAPSGKLVVEEEYEEARQRNLCILVFVKTIKRDQQAENFVNRLSEYVNGVFRTTFITPDELQKAVEKALAPIIQHNKNPGVNMNMINEKLRNPYKIHDEASMRFLLTPERIDEFIDPVSLESPALKHQLFEIGHSPQVELFSYERPKKIELETNSIVILQSEEGRHRDIVEEVRLEVTTEGFIIIDINVTGFMPKTQGHDLMSFMVIIEGDISTRLKKCFAFAGNFLQDKDPFKRYDRMLYNVVLSGVGHRTLMKNAPKGSSCPMGTHDNEIIIAFDSPRLITRENLLCPEKEIEAVIALLRRRLK
ncbi:MAG: DUF4062 domain-containing protein [Deltaproteobacteria bacterium]|nr:DUF4062 domain-containing protein [Deltaproteobacteria bacterium]